MTALLLTLDVEEFVIPGELGIPFDLDRAHALGAEGLAAAAAVLAKHRVPATLFVTKTFAERYVSLLRDLQASGHEIGLHAWDHSHDYEAMTPSEAEDWLGRARRWIQDSFDCECPGYRANQFKSPAREVLERIGIRWTSNLHPTKVPGHYDHRHLPRKIHRQGKLIEVPISVTPKLRLPVSWFWMRNLGRVYLRATARRASIHSGYLNIYLHPWEFAKLPRLSGLGLMGKLSIRRAGKPFLADLDRLLRWCEDWGMEGQTISQHLEASSWIQAP